MPDYARMYAGQDYMTPGAAQTVGIIADTVRFADNPWLLEVAAGKGTAAATLAGQYTCRIVCVEPNRDICRARVSDRIRRRGLGDRVRVVQANGRQLPIRTGVMNAAYCIGAPSIVGLTAALAEMTRVVVPGGQVIVSDITWRDQPGPLGPEWRWVADAAQTTTDQYVAELTSAGLRVSRVTVHGRAAWETYWASMLSVAQRRDHPRSRRRPLVRRRCSAAHRGGTPRRRRLARLHHLHHGKTPVKPRASWCGPWRAELSVTADMLIRCCSDTTV